ncbi:hypothetical protein E3N88_25682 [Mikania micrantha]|uniref:Uncharacterized protein n=1 Tax=Mikania micrantha TaxID=192012 RepID=A0A5N6N5K8_9ASTR|nr:hypothetical protein E3N88_25682 [Mikania micrantha]
MTTRAMAHFRRPVPISVWAAKPPGSLDLTNFSRFEISKSAVRGSAKAVATTVREGVFVLGNWDDFRVGASETEKGFCETCEENEREEKEDVRVEREIAISVGFELSGFAEEDEVEDDGFMCMQQDNAKRSLWLI